MATTATVSAPYSFRVFWRPLNESSSSSSSRYGREQPVNMDVKIIVPCSNLKQTVREFMPELTRRLGRYTSSEEFAIRQLRTSDGFLLDDSDQLGAVLGHGDVLEAVSQETWQKENAALIEATWAEVSVEDLVDDDYKWVRVGLHRHNRLFVSLGRRTTLQELELFDPETLERFGKAGTALVLHQRGKSGYAIEASFEVDASSRVVAVLLSVRTGSSDRAAVKRVAVQIDERQRLSAGAVTQVQSPFAPVDAKRLAAYPIPPAKRNGPELLTAAAATPGAPAAAAAAAAAVATPAAAAATTGLTFELSSPVTGEQTGLRSEGINYSRFLVPLTLNNRGAERVTIKRWQMEWRMGGAGEWAPVDDLLMGESAFHGRRPEMAAFEGKSLYEVPLIGTVKRTGLPAERDNHRVHSSFGAQVSLRVTLFDQDDHALVWETQYNRKPLLDSDLPTRASREADAGRVPAYFWLQLDDTVAEHRSYVAAFERNRPAADGAAAASSSSPHSLEVRTSDSGSTVTISARTVRRLLRDARAANTAELPLTDFGMDFDIKDSTVGPLWSNRATALVDLAAGIVWGIRFAMRTTTGDAEAVMPLIAFQEEAEE